MGEDWRDVQHAGSQLRLDFLAEILELQEFRRGIHKRVRGQRLSCGGKIEICSLLNTFEHRALKPVRLFCGMQLEVDDLPSGFETAIPRSLD
jgi:hypothetical protein